MKISRISRIKGHRIFRDFSWPSGLTDFGRYNLIFGWNGSGKSTLSNLFRHIEKRENIEEGEVTFVIGSRTVSGATLSSDANLPNIRVFNRTFIDINVFKYGDSNDITPIFFIGEENIEKEKKVVELKRLLNSEKGKLSNLQDELKVAGDAFENFCSQHAKSIKAVLSSSGSNPYNSYNKANLKTSCEAMASGNTTQKGLSDDEQKTLKLQTQGTAKEQIDRLKITVPDLASVRGEVDTLLGKTILSRVIDKLAKDATLADWVKQGLPLHEGSDTCRFCGQPLPADRLTDLHEHFNDEFRRCMTNIADIRERLETAKSDLDITLPAKSAFYDDLAERYSSASKEIHLNISNLIAYIDLLLKALVDKSKTPFESLSLDTVTDAVVLPDANASRVSIESANQVIDEHNTRSENFQKTVDEARKRLEDGSVADIIDDYRTKRDAVTAVEGQKTSVQQSVNSTTQQIADLEKEIIEHRRPADELNNELRTYLGRDELQFDVKDTGYIISRRGAPATNLSEGEKSAIAFLYFLKSLQDRQFDMSTGIVVVDDPVSSLDESALFSAFSFMKERTKLAGQLFVLTHNAGLFRQTKNWLNHQPGQNKKDVTKHLSHFFMIKSEFAENGERGSSLSYLDPLLHEYDSDYHYIFGIVNGISQQPENANSLARFYELPNLARRLLEAFLAFRYPSQRDDLRQKLEKVNFDSVKKTKIIRFVHTHSHDSIVGAPEHDMTVLMETPQILKDILDLIKSEDSHHFEQMKAIVAPPAPATEEA